MKYVIAPLFALLFATVTFAAPPEPETPGSEGPKAAAEAQHIPKTHGIDKTAKQPAAQAMGNVSSQAAAEANHLKKSHGNVNNSADERMMRDAARL